ncbi:MAG: sensor histidine kinase [Betaproteobacteria bacterium]|nr:sensor histidine kinase [Betaproteobacteria bacterium]
MVRFARLSLSRQFLLAGLPILLAGMLVIGTWVGTQIEASVIHRIGVVTGLYVNSFVAPHLQQLPNSGQLNQSNRTALDSLLGSTLLGQRIVAFKIWGRDGRIVYSTNPALIGRTFPVTQRLASAFSGEVHSGIADLNEPENEFERRQWSQLIETYAPVHADGTGAIIAVSEFYQSTDELTREVRAARFRSWLVVGAVTLLTYLLLFGLAARASNTIDAQQQELREKVAQLTALLDQNQQLHERVRRAAARTTALNERFLRRISADLHDGPGQDLGLALMRIEGLADTCINCPEAVDRRCAVTDDFLAVRSALQSALTDLRSISAGLHLPEIGRLSLADTAARAVRDYERKTRTNVALTVGNVPPRAALPVKITLYRLLQESLANSFRHAGSCGQRVNIDNADGQVVVEVADSGPGFDSRTSAAEEHLGLAGIRERVEVLGGTFELHTAPGQGTVIRVCLPLAVPEVENE